MSLEPPSAEFKISAAGSERAASMYQPAEHLGSGAKREVGKMAKFTICVQETVIVTYDEVEIEASSLAEAERIAEEMRVQGDLGTPTEAVEAVDYYED